MNNNMNDKLIRHIKNKLIEKDEVLDHFDMATDEQIKYLMLMTFEIVENECLGCFFCKNYKRFSMGSLCKIKPHTKKNCYHFTIDIQKVLKKKYYHILLKISEATWGKHIATDRNLSSKTRKNIIYESIRLYEMIQTLKDVEINYQDSELMGLSGEYGLKCMYMNY